MVLLHVKRYNENQFLFETKTEVSIEKLLKEIVSIYNGRLKVKRICMEIEDLADHGVMLPLEIIGLTDEQVEELKLVDVWADKCIPSGGFIMNKDPIGKRNGRQPKSNMQKVLKNAIEDAKKIIDKKLVDINKSLTLKNIEEALNILKGAVMIVYPMQLPPHDPIRMELTNTEDLSGTQASLEVIELSTAQLWFAGHYMLPDKKLCDYIGTNEKSKIIVKLTKIKEGAPSREPIISEDDKKLLMAAAYRKQEELKVSVT